MTERSPERMAPRAFGEATHYAEINGQQVPVFPYDAQARREEALFKRSGGSEDSVYDQYVTAERDYSSQQAAEQRIRELDAQIIAIREQTENFQQAVTAELRNFAQEIAAIEPPDRGALDEALSAIQDLLASQAAPQGEDLRDALREVDDTAREALSRAEEALARAAPEAVNGTLGAIGLTNITIRNSLFTGGSITALSTALGVNSGGTGAQNAADARTNLGAQEADADLTALAALTGTGMLARTAADTYAERTIAGGTGVTVTNGDGVAGAPSIAIGQAVGSGDSPTFASLTLTGILGFGTPSEQTIASGEITATKNYHLVDTESDAATDDLVTINGGVAGQILVLQTVVAARDVVVEHNTGNIRLRKGADRTLGHKYDTIVLIYNDVDGYWYEISYTDNS